jgi:hypothetical protein
MALWTGAAQLGTLFVGGWQDVAGARARGCVCLGVFGCPSPPLTRNRRARDAPRFRVAL